MKLELSTIRTGATLVAVLFLSGCIAMDVPDDIEYSQSHSLYEFNCKKPFELTRGCSGNSYASLPYEFEGRKTYLSSSDDGRIVFLSNHVLLGLGTAPVAGYTMGVVDIYRWTLNAGLRAVLSELSNQGLTVLDIHLVTNLWDVDGYLLFVDGDAFDALAIQYAGE